jgi:DNA invertase Pin-like site-specific DNA recombinase
MPRGEQHGNSRLKEWQIPYIRTLLENGASHADIARAYNVDKATIGRIARGKTWTHI